MMKSGDLAGRVVLVVCNLAVCAEGKTALLDGHAVEVVVEMLRDPELDESTRENCVAALYSLSQGSLRFKGLAKEAKAAEVLKVIMERGSERAKEKAKRPSEIMSQKRQPEEDYKPLPDGGLSDDKRRRKIPSLKRLLKEPVLEPLIRRVKERMASSLRVALVDALSGQVVTTGPESSAKVEIVVLEGDFDSDEGNNWTVEEFRDNIVREREGKKPLLNGDAILNLKDGIGLVGDISFTDNSSWTRSRKFRLGARLVDNFDGIKVIEAKTESFVVRDHRGELYKKHHPPSLLDEVWRLEKIGKDGAFHRRLSKERIYTVKDFLTLLSLDPARLRNILGTGMSTKMWEVTVEHARTLQTLHLLWLILMAPNNNALAASQKAPMCDYQPSPDNMPSIYSIGGLSGLDPYDLHSIDIDAVTQPFCGDEPLPYFDSDYSFTALAFEQSDSYLQSAVNSFLGRTNGPPQIRHRGDGKCCSVY
nr:calmodulin-binding protein 60 A [Ipomoea batatas]